MKKRLPYLLISAYGLINFAVHCAAAYLFRLVFGQVYTSTRVILTVLFCLVGYAGQLVLGALIKKAAHARFASMAGLFLLMLALILPISMYYIGVALAGLGLALVSVSGGVYVVKLNPGKIFGIAIFTSMGLFGWVMGYAWGILASFMPIILLGLLLLLLPLAFFLRVPDNDSTQPIPVKKPKITRSFWWVAMILLGMLLAYNFFYAGQEVLSEKPIYMVIWAVMLLLGQLMGGFLADRMPRLVWLAIAMGLGVLLVSFGSSFAPTVIIGSALIMSLMPVCFATVATMLPEKPGMAAGLTLGLAVFFGNIPILTGITALTKLLTMVNLTIPAWAYYLPVGFISALMMFLGIRASLRPPKYVAAPRPQPAQAALQATMPVTTPPPAAQPQQNYAQTWQQPNPQQTAYAQPVYPPQPPRPQNAPRPVITPPQPLKPYQPDEDPPQYY